MEGKVAVITGGNSGIGKATAVALARAGADILIAARDDARGRKAVEEIRRLAGSDLVDLVVFDLGDLRSVRRGASEILDRSGRIDVLLNNAGLVLSSRTVTEDGFETTFGVNHLGPFYLTGLLIDRLVASAPSRVVNVSSSAHRQVSGGLDFDDLQAERIYNGIQVYARSKLANILFTTELARRLDGTGVTVNAVHPGVVATGYGRDGDTNGIVSLGLTLIRPFVLSPEKGSRTLVYLASSPEVARESGSYFSSCRKRQPSAAALDADSARRLWSVSEELVAQALDGRG